MTRLFKRLARDGRGSFAIETAFVLPMLIMMTLGIFEVGRMVARQHELQSAANEAEIIVLATNQGALSNVADIRQIVRESVNIAGGDIQLRQRYRCGTNTTLVVNLSVCLPTQQLSSYLLLDISEDFTPIWTYMGVGRPITFTVERRIQVS